MRKRWKRLLAALCAVGWLLGGGLVPARAAEEAYDAAKAISPQRALAFLDEDMRLAEGFSSHLPVVVIGEDGAASLYAEGRTLNAGLLDGGSSLEAACTEQWSAGAAAGLPARDKIDYSMQLSDEALEEWSARLWDSPVQNSWYLLGGMYDKSLMRNYLALTLAAELDIAAYTAHYCEVFAATADGYEYRGVYLLAAPLKTDDQYIQRGNYWDADSLPLNTYAFRQGRVGEDLFVPSQFSQDEEGRSALGQAIDRAERTFYSSDYNAFSQYDDHLDMTKLYDYFVIYELFGNYSAGYLARYLYNAQSDRLWPVVLADFEYALDNERDRPMDTYDVEMIFAPYYEPLTKSFHFVDGLLRRYRLLVQDTLKGSNLAGRIDAVVALLGEAQLRDWQRWEDVYNGVDMYMLSPMEAEPDDTLPALNRNTYSYEQEINKLKFTLREHGSYMFGGLSELYQQDNMVGNDARYVMNTWLFVVFLVIIIISVRFVRYRTR